MAGMVADAAGHGGSMAGSAALASRPPAPMATAVARFFVTTTCCCAPSCLERTGLHPTFLPALEHDGRMPSLKTVFLPAEPMPVTPGKRVRRLERLRANPLR
jgi:hypothetical protein